MPRFLAHAKINLFLRVLARETGGFHQIETLFSLIDLADEICVDPAPRPGILLEVEGADLGEPEQNLAWRAAALFGAETGEPPSVRIALRKRIPVGAGLGGGSSDAACTLFALETLAGTPAATPARLARAARLGSDTSFFALRRPLALAWSRGERLLALPAPPSRPVLLAVPEERVSTAAAYAWLADRRGGTTPATPRVLDTSILSSWDGIESLAENDFEHVILDRIPETAALRSALLRHEARLALLSGSGSAVFGVFDDHDARDRAAARLRTRFPRATVIVTRTLTNHDVDPT